MTLNISGYRQYPTARQRNYGLSFMRVNFVPAYP